jgi:hypothetical protein
MIAQFIEVHTAHIDSLRDASERTHAETHYQFGYADGSQCRGMLGSLSNDPNYLEGWSDGYKDWKAQQPPVNLEGCAWSEGSLTRDLF